MSGQRTGRVRRADRVAIEHERIREGAVQEAPRNQDGEGRSRPARMARKEEPLMYKLIEAMGGLAMIATPSGVALNDPETGIPVIGSRASIERLIEALNTDNG